MTNSAGLPGPGMWGWVEIGEIGPAPPMVSTEREQSNRSTNHLVRRMTWRPGPGLRASLPADYTLEFDIHEGPESRRIAPVKGAGSLILPASFAGHELLMQTGRLKAPGSLSYDAMGLLVQFADRLRENLAGFRFTRLVDLYISIMGEPDCLPSDLVLPEAEVSNPVSVAQLIARGEAAAKETQLDQRNHETFIRLGLREYAGLNPINIITLTAEQATRIVRFSIFDAGPAEQPVIPNTTTMIHSRIEEAIKQHFLNDSISDFERWSNGVANLVHQISKRKGDGGPIPRPAVRQVLLEAVFESYRYIGKCVSAIMAEIADSLLNPLSAKDRAAFDVMYIGQPWLGDIPLVLLRKHFDLVGEICLDILANPTSAELKGQLLRVLEWHGSMVSKKREADRLRKNSSVSRNLEGRPTKAFTNTDDDFVTPERPQASVYQQAAGKFRELRNASCPCGCLSGWQASFSVDSLREDTVQWVDVCGNCNHQEPVEVSREDFGRRVDEVDV